MGQPKRTPLVVVVTAALSQRLHAEADQAAKAKGLSERDLSYGFFLGDHIGSSLETTYLARDDAPIADAGDSEPLTMVAVSFSPATAEQLQARADAAAEHEGLSALTPGYSDFVEGYMGRCLEAAAR